MSNFDTVVRETEVIKPEEVGNIEDVIEPSSSMVHNDPDGIMELPVLNKQNKKKKRQ